MIEVTTIGGQPASQSEIGVTGQVEVEGTVAGLPVASHVWACVFDGRGTKLLDWSCCEVDGGRWRSVLCWQDGEIGVGTEFVVKAVVSAIEPNRGRAPLARSRGVKVVKRSPPAGDTAN